MKKIILNVLAFIISSSISFAYVRVGDLMDTLIESNQLKVRLNQAGVLVGTDTLRFSVGATADPIIFSNGAATNGNKGIRLGTSPFVSFGYKTPAFGIAFGYQFQNFYTRWTVHAVAIALTFLENNLRILVPFRIGVANENNKYINHISALDLGPEGVWVRYHTGVEALPQVRLYVRYGSITFAGYSEHQGVKDYSDSSLGVQLRVYFKKFMAGNVGIQPLVRLHFNASLTDREFKAGSGSIWGGASHIVELNEKDIEEAYENMFSHDYKKTKHIQAVFPVEFTAANDFIDFLIRPDLGFDIVTGKTDFDTTKKAAQYSLVYNFYSEINFYATKSLSFYFESDIGGKFITSPKEDPVVSDPLFTFAANAGITWKF